MRSRRGTLALGLVAGALLALNACTRGGRPAEPGLPARTARPVEGWARLSELRPPEPRGLETGEASLWERAWNALALDRLEESYRLATELHRSRPDLGGARALLGWIELRAGRSDAARRHFEAARSLASDEPTRISARSGTFLTALQSGRREEAFEELEALRAAAPDHVLAADHVDPLRMELAETWLRRGRDLGDADPLSAARALERSLYYAPEAVDLHLELARFYRSGGALDRALESAERAVGARPRHAPALELYADLLESEGRIEDAREVYDAARELAPFDSELAASARSLERRSRARVDRRRLDRIREGTSLTREAFAAVLCHSFPDLLDSTRRSPVIVTDVDESWARDCILATLAAGLQEAYPGHRFEPEAKVTRAELDESLGRVARGIDLDCARSAVTDAPCGGATSSLARERLNEWTRGSSRPSGALALAAARSLAEVRQLCVDAR